jgi:anti-anti-sigma factor
MELSVESLEQGIKVIHLVGRMDLRGAQEVDLAFMGHAAAAKGLIVVDLAGVEFLASLGLRTLISGAKAQRGKGGRLALAGAQALVSKVLSSSGIHNLIPIYPTVAEAVASLSVPAAGASPTPNA